MLKIAHSAPFFFRRVLHSIKRRALPHRPAKREREWEREAKRGQAMKTLSLPELEACCSSGGSSVVLDTDGVVFPLAVADAVAELILRKLAHLHSTSPETTTIRLRSVVDDAKREVYNTSNSDDSTNNNKGSFTLPVKPLVPGGYRSVPGASIDVHDFTPDYDPPFPAQSTSSFDTFPSAGTRPPDMPWFEDEHQILGSDPSPVPNPGSNRSGPSLGQLDPRSFDADRDPLAGLDGATPSMTFLPRSGISRRGFNKYS